MQWRGVHPEGIHPEGEIGGEVFLSSLFPYGYGLAPGNNERA